MEMNIKGDSGVAVDGKAVYAVIVSALIFGCSGFAGQEGSKIILFFMSLFVTGSIATGVKHGFLLRFVLSFVFSLANGMVFLRKLSEPFTKLM